MNSENRYDSLLQYYGEQYAVDWRFIKAVVRAESDFSPSAVSKVGAKGLMQFMDNTWKEWRDGTVGIQEVPGDMPFSFDSSFDVEQNIRAGSAYYAHLIQYWNKLLSFPVGLSTMRCAMASYNWGIGNVLKHLKEGFVGLPQETKEYIQRIEKFYNQYLTVMVDK